MKSRRDFLKYLPALPLLPGLLSKLGSAPTAQYAGNRLPMWRDGLGNWCAGFGEPLADGAMLHTRLTYNPATRMLIEKVQWITKRGETVDGSTHYFR